MKDLDLKIEYIDVNKLTPYKNNARKHAKIDIDAIKKSIEAFGMNDPIGVYSDKLIIVEGHGRLLACKELGIDKVPCIRLDHLTDEERKAYTLAHNKTAELSMWDLEALKIELDGLDGVIDMTDFGFVNAEDIDFDSIFESEAVSNDKDKKYKVIYEAETEADAETVKSLLEENGYKCKVV